jgi:SAM-dependent methyltransferase
MIDLMPLPSNRDHTNRVRAESFGADAVAYDRVRPSYPAALIDDLLAARPGGVLDVGCGTGKVARLIAARGRPVLGVEIDERMAAVACQHGIDVEVGRFETWDPAGRRFDLIVSGQAWHWIDPERGARRAVDVLRAGGLLAPFWNFSSVDPTVRARIDATYARIAPQITQRSVRRSGGPTTIPAIIEHLEGTGLFVGVEHRRYPWDHDYTRGEWLALTQTHSDHSTLPSAQLAALIAALDRAIADDVVHVHYVTEAILARPARR